MSYRYRVSPTPKQASLLVRHCADARYVWNLALEQANLYRTGQPTPNGAQRMRQLADARQDSWLGEGSSSVQQAALRDFDQALRNWWTGSHRRPTWRRKDLHEGFCIRDVNVRKLNRRWAEVTVPKAGRVQFRLSRSLPAHGSARVTMDRVGRWHVSFTAPQAPVERSETGMAVGLDRGIAVTAAASDGRVFQCPTPTSGERARRARLQRRLARQQKGSNRRARTRLAIAKLTTRHADRRKDWVEKTSTTLVHEGDVIVLEDLRVRNMMRSATGTVEAPGVNVAQKRGLNRSISEHAWSMLARRITDKAEASDVDVVLVPAPGTSQTCSKCGYRHADNRRSQAEFRCGSCGYEDNADLNAAVNIRAAGLAVLARGGADSSRADEPRTPRKERGHAA